MAKWGKGCAWQAASLTPAAQSRRQFQEAYVGDEKVTPLVTQGPWALNLATRPVSPDGQPSWHPNEA
jgi:hypothetical protein